MVEVDSLEPYDLTCEFGWVQGKQGSVGLDVQLWGDAATCEMNVCCMGYSWQCHETANGMVWKTHMTKAKDWMLHYRAKHKLRVHAQGKCQA